MKKKILLILVLTAVLITGLYACTDKKPEDIEDPKDSGDNNNNQAEIPDIPEEPAPAFYTDMIPGEYLTLSADRSKTYQTIEGFGFAHGLRAGSMDQYKWFEKVVGEMGLTMWRTSVEAGDTYTVPSEHPDWQDRRGSVLKLKEAADMLGEPLRVILTVWSPPGVWKVKLEPDKEHGGDIGGTQSLARANEIRDLKIPYGSASKGGTLNPDHYEDFARFMVEAIRMYEDIGVEVYAVSLQNESGFWEEYDSCIYTWEWYADLLEICVPIIKAEYPDVLIFGAECMLGFQAPDMGWWETFLYAKHIKANRPEAWALLDRVATHGYQDGVVSEAVDRHAVMWTQQKTKYGTDAGKINWMTETSGYVNNWIDGTDQGQSALSLAIAIQTGLLYGDMAAWVWWSGHDPVDGGYCLVEGNGVSGKKYEVSRQFYRYIRPGAVRIEAGFDKTVPSTLTATAYKHDALDNHVIVFVNSGGENYQINIDMPGVDIANWDCYITIEDAAINNTRIKNIGGGVNIPAHSVVTIVSGGYIGEKGEYLTAAGRDARDVEITKNFLNRINDFSIATLYAPTQEAARAEAIQQITGRVLAGVRFELDFIDYAPAVNEIDVDDPANAKNGYYRFKIKLTKGDASAETNPIDLTIIYSTSKEAALTVDPSVTYQTIEGIGFKGAENSDEWAALAAGDLGASMWYAWIEPENTSTTHPGNSVKALADAYSAANNGGKLKALLTVMSPPADMKTDTGDNPLSSGRLDPAKYGEFAAWLIEIIERYIALGIDVYAVSYAYEPHWAHDFQNSCSYDSAQYNDMIKGVTPLLKNKYSDIKIAVGFMPMMFNLAGWAGEILQGVHRDAAARELVDIYMTNGAGNKGDWGIYYSGGSNPAFGTDPSKTHWAINRSGGGDWMTEAIWAAHTIQTDLLYGNVSGIVHQGSLNSGDRTYHAFRHFTNFIKPGALRLGSSVSPENDGDNLLTTVFKNADGSYVITFVNVTTDDFEITLDAGGLPEKFEYFISTASPEDIGRHGGETDISGGIAVPAKSVVTLISN